jgi:hypothetical protein
MSSRFQSYADTETGRTLAALMDAPEFIPEFRALSRIGKPAVQAIGSEVAQTIEALPSKADKDAASQFCGWFVGQIMRRLGYRVVQERGRVTGAPFKTGAVWESENRPVQIVNSLPPMCSRRIELKVWRAEDGELLGQWDAVHTASNPIRRVHTIVEVAKPVDSALQHATEYAEKWGFNVIWVQDPQRLFPIKQAPAPSAHVES